MSKWVTIRRKEFRRLQSAETFVAWLKNQPAASDYLDAEKALEEARAEIAMLSPDAELGRLVRQMPVGFSLRKLVALSGNGWTWQCGKKLPPGSEDCKSAYEPDTVLREVLKENAPE